MTLPTTYRGPALQMIYGPVKLASAALVDTLPLDESFIEGARFKEIGGVGTPLSARVVVPYYPPAEWLSDEAADAAPNTLTIYPSGRMAGIVAPAGRCLLGGDASECWTVPRPSDGRGSTLAGDPSEELWNARTAGDMYLADGQVIRAAPLAGEGGHASPFATDSVAQDHYANTDRQVGRGRFVWSDKAGQGIGGIVFVGSLVPTITEERLIVARGSANSIDFRWQADEDRYDLKGVCNVNIAGMTPRWRQAALESQPFILTEPSPQETHIMETTTHSCSCGGATKLAAYQLVPLDPTEPPSNARVTWGVGMVGAFDGSLAMADGSVVWMIRPEINGELADYDERVGVAAAQCTVTGERYDWESDLADTENMVRAASADVPGMISDPEAMAMLSAIQGGQDEILAKVDDLHAAMLEGRSGGATVGL